MMRSWVSLLAVVAMLIVPYHADAQRGGDGEADTPTEGSDPFGTARQAMLVRIQEHAAAVHDILAGAAIDEQVMRAINAVPRHEFVPAHNRRRAYLDMPLPIGFGQTISQPFIVALMTDLLDIEPGDKVLEIGTGSGYQAAVLAELGAETYTIEIIPELGEQASERLQRLGYRSIETRIGDGYFGWPEMAPFDAIIVTAAGANIPPPLVRQLETGGRMIVPVGGAFVVQQLVLIERLDDDQTRVRQLLPVVFVPLTGGPR